MIFKGPIKGTNQRDQSKRTNQRDQSIGQLNDVQSLIKLIVIMLRFKKIWCTYHAELCWQYIGVDWMNWNFAFYYVKFFLKCKYSWKQWKRICFINRRLCFCMIVKIFLSLILAVCFLFHTCCMFLFYVVYVVE